MPHSRFLTVLTLFCLVLTAWLVLPLPALSAGTINVTTSADESGAGSGCSLREALTSANTNANFGGCTGAGGGSPFTINVPAGTYNLSVDELLVGTSSGANITISGAGPDITIINQTNSSFRVFELDPSVVGNVAVTITGVTISGGYAQAFGGGAILGGGTNDSLTLSNVVISNNHCAGFFSGAGISWSPAGNLTISNTAFANNTCANGAGGAILYTTGNGSSLTITNSIFSGNIAGATDSAGGAIFVGGNGGSPTFSINSSTFLNNQAINASSIGGAIYLGGGTLNLGNISANRFVGNSAGISSSGGLGVRGGTANATNNWWGCNGGPGTGSGCDRADNSGGTLNFTPWVVLTHAASPNSIQVNQTSTLTVDFLHNSAGGSLPVSQIGVLVGLPISFGGTTRGTLSGGQTSIQVNGTATATFTANADGAGSANATVDYATATANITITLPPPEIAVLGNGVEITNGDTIPSLADHTDFGSAAVTGGQVSRTFTISNSDSANLTVGAINFTGPAAGDFSVTAAPASPVSPGGTTTFQVTFDPSALGLRSATLSIANNDSDENPYNFAIQGTGAPPPALGVYPAASVALSGNITVTPDAAPANTTGLNVSTSTDFKGTFAANPTTGVVTVTDAHPAGTYNVRVRAFGAGGTTIRTFTLTVAGGTACAGTCVFTNAADVGVGSGSASVAIGDFNNDGRQDLATANANANTVSIRLGNGSGGFSGTTNVSVGNFPYSVGIGDFNHDGRQDLATANINIDTVSIRLGDGSGGFGGTTEVSVGDFPRSVAIGDFNQDGHQDLATANYNSGTVSIRLGNGSGGFSGTTEVNVGVNPTSVALGDFNNDGNQDLAASNYTTGTVSIRLGNGSGGFSGTTEVSVIANPYSVAIGDFNQDGHQDLAASNRSTNTVSIRLGNGSGGFSGTTEVNVGANPYAVAIGDFNNDGRQDFAATNSGATTVSIGLGDGSGGFSGTTTVGVGANPYAVAIGDFNQDGVQDLATANLSTAVSIRLGDCGYTVTFDAQGGAPTPGNQILASGALVTDPGNPTRAGYTFNGWYDAPSGGNLWNFATDTMGAGNMTLYAQWTDITAPTVDTFTATSPSTSLDIPITAFTATDNTAVTGYLITESSTPPAAGDAGWAGTAPTIYTVASPGTYTLYPWARDAAGNVSAVFGSPRSVTVCYSSVTVTSNADSGAGSLRQAIADVCSGGTIDFAADTAIYLDSQLDINKTLTIDGETYAITVSGDSGHDNDRDVRVFNIQSSGVATLTHLSIVSGTHYAGGGILNDGLLTVVASRLIDNGANDGGGIYNDGGTLTVQTSTFSGNSASHSFGGGISNNSGTLTVQNSTFSGNSANDGGGIFNFGTLIVGNSTFSGNSASSPSPYGGGGIFNSGTLTLTNTLLAHSPSGGDCVNGSGTIATNDHNLIEATGSNACGLTNGTGGSIIGVDPLLAPLGDYGGSTETFALLPGSPAIDAGAACLSTDQRGIARTFGSACDIGAFESRGFAFTYDSGSPQSAVVNTAFANPLVLTINSTFAEPVNGGQVVFTGPGSGASTNPQVYTATISGGAASQLVTANGTAGSYTVSADTRGNLGSAISYNLTNQAPEMAVLGNGVEIAGGDATPSLTDYTDFGSALLTGGQIIRTFTIGNSGSADLTIGAINFTGPAAGDFSVTTPPASPVAPGGTTTFEVTFDPSAVGPRVATLSIANDDGDENPYNFTIQGIGTIPLVFSEIMYNPASVEPAWEWVEVYNAGSTTIDLAGFVLDDDHIPAVAAANIAAGSVSPGQTAILYNADVVNAANFQAAWGNNLNLVAVSNWPPLTNTGDRLTLWNSFASYGGGVANAVEDVFYDDSGSWPSYDNAASIYLTNLSAANTSGANWALSTVGGSTPTGVGYRSQNTGGNNGSDIGSPGTPFPTVQFSQASYQVNEDGTAVGATVTLNRSGDTSAASQVQVNFTNNTATGSGTDYTSTPIVITFPAGDTGSQTVSVPISQDFVDETTESLTMNVISLSNAQIGSQDTAALQILDDDTAGTVVNPTSLTISEPGGSATFNIRLTSQPTAIVTIDLTLSSGECSVDTDPVTLDDGNWQTGVTVAVTAVDDLISDGPQPCNITTAQTTSSDPVYSSTFNPEDVMVTVNDDDVPGLTIVESSGGTAVTEGGATDTYTVRLNTVPTANVTVSVATGGQINPVAALTFPANPTALDPQIVTIAATDDTIVEGDHSQVIGHSASGGGYDSVSISDVTAAITDNDLAYAISADQTTVTEGNSGATAISFTLTRSGAVTTTAGSVDFSLGGTATGSDYDNVSPTPGAVSFTAGQTQRQITLDVLGDFGVEPDETILVTLSNASAPGSGTATITTASGQTTITNDDSPGFTVNPIAGLITAEAAGTASFTVRLNSQPTTAVTVTLTSSDPGEGTPSPAVLVFNPTNWASNQTVIVTGQDDLAADGDMAYTIQTGVVSSDSDYSSLDPADVALTNLDDDTPGYTISPNNFTLSEGGSQVVSITLYTPPAAPVTIQLSSSDPSACTVSPASVTLNAGNYQTGVSFTISGVYDGLDDGTQPCTIVTTASSSDSAYGGLDPDDIALSVFERRIYLPLIVNGFVSAPDLVVTSMTNGPNGPNVTIRNAGNAAVTNAFWVDVYFNPNSAPPPLNQTWQSTAPYGGHWGVTAALDPSQSLTLTVGGPYYAGGSSSFPAGAKVYAYVDSINYATSYGNVQESNEANNVLGPVDSLAAGSLPVGTAAVSAPEGLPER